MVTVKNPILMGFYPGPFHLQKGRGLLYRQFKFCVCTGSADLSQQRSRTLGADR